MVARTPPKLRKAPAPLNPVLLRETVKKVDRCMARLQELQYTVAGGRKVVSGVSLSPRSTRGYLRTSLRCKQESLRIENGATLKSPVGKFPRSAGGEWRRMSLPAMLVGETVGEILQATQFAREILSAVSSKASNKQLIPDDPKTPMTHRKNLKAHPENTELQARRRREKQNKTRESHSPSLQRARSRINFKVSPPKQRDSSEKENGRYLANRVSPRHKPWARKTVLFPNPLFLSTPSKQNQQQKFCKTRSPVIANKKRQGTSPHKFLIKSPSSASKFQVKIKSPPKVSVSPPMRHSTKALVSSTNGLKLRHSFSPSKLRRSFSPSRIANRLMSPLKSRKSVQKSSSDGLMAMSGLKQRPVAMPGLTFSSRRIN
ncbi:microtubule-binding protein TANGLED isoform X1 [Punica granatum]|uniref:Microtubule-binding protein TANGLED isoform X1 n=1 Tax=Punica granatum TaxID=22663 RepID=A0A6P8E8J6_PUNGR|nr:microtubule-binding protein TANGLED isoform X1 [Punica granatum]